MSLDAYWTEALSWLTVETPRAEPVLLIVPEQLSEALRERGAGSHPQRVISYRQLSDAEDIEELDEGALALLHRGLEQEWPNAVRVALFHNRFEHLQANDVFSLVQVRSCPEAKLAGAGRLQRWLRLGPSRLPSRPLSQSVKDFFKRVERSNRRLAYHTLIQNPLSLPELRYQLDALLARMIGTQGWESETSPNTSAVGTELRDLNLMKTNIKVLAWKVEQLEALLQRPGVTQGVSMPIEKCLESSTLTYSPSTAICTASDLDAAWHRNLCALIGATNPLLRKLWEWTYSLKVFWDLGVFQRRGSGLGFGCGSEPMASLCANFAEHVLVTDAPPHVIDGKGWSDTNQHTAELSDARFPAMAPGVDLDAVLDFEFVDMNAIPEHLYDRFDFVWSSCALEHLGSKRAGLAFIANSLRCLKPGGVAVHTTEYDLSGTSTIDHWDTVLFNQNDFEQVLPDMVRELEEEQPGRSYELMPLKLERGQAFLDGYVDIPPYSYHPSPNAGFHPDQDTNYGYPMLNLSVDGFPCTSIAVVIRRLT